MTGTAHELAEQIAALREPFEQVMQDARRGVHRGATEAGSRPVTAEPPPTIEERLAALEVLATVPVILGPGEALIIRTTDLNPNQMCEYQESLDYRYEVDDLPFRVIVVHGDELAAARPAPEPPAFMKDVREDVFRDETVAGVRLTHLPTGVTAEGPTQAEAVGRLAKHLFTRGHISVNTARSAYGLPPFDGDFADKPLEPRG